MSEKETAIVILAAGKGTRMQSDIPKVLHKVGCRSMIEHVIGSALTLKPRPVKIVTVLSRNMEKVQQTVSEYSEVVIQETQQGTADAVKYALPNLKGFKGNVLILYADTPLLTHVTMHNMLDALATDVAVSVLGFTPDDATGYGRLVVNKEGELEKITEHKDASDEERKITLCNSGVIAVKGGLLHSLLKEVSNQNAKHEYYLTDIIGIARKKGHICTYIEGSPQEVIGVNNRIQLAEVEKIYQNRLRTSVMMKGVTLIDPDTTYLAHDMKVGRDITIHPNVVFGPGVILEDNVEVLSFCHIEGASIGEGSKIGPFARIRPGTDIDENVRIGNFVEVKKSEIHKGVKLGHLSYIGDTTIGENTNVGAGTITCNYDGFNKYPTAIGRDVFIGSHSSLVAPVKIGDGALIAAGSTITHNVAPDALSIARNKQENQENGAEKFRHRKKARKEEAAH